MHVPPRLGCSTGLACTSLLVAIFIVASPGRGAAQDSWFELGPADGMAFLTALAFDPARADVVYAGLEGGGFATSVDGGLNWHHSASQLDGQVPTQITSTPALPGTLFVLTSLVVFSSNDGGNRWTALGPLPSAMWGLACD